MALKSDFVCADLLTSDWSTTPSLLLSNCWNNDKSLCAPLLLAAALLPLTPLALLELLALAAGEPLAEVSVLKEDLSALAANGKAELAATANANTRDNLDFILCLLFKQKNIVKCLHVRQGLRCKYRAMGEEIRTIPGRYENQHCFSLGKYLRINKKYVAVYGH